MLSRVAAQHAPRALLAALCGGAYASTWTGTVHAEGQVQAVPTGTKAPSAPKLRSLTQGKDFQVYDRSGQPARLDDVVAAMDAADVVLLGEYHDDPVAHSLELRLFKAAAERYGAAGPAAGAAAAAAAVNSSATAAAAAPGRTRRRVVLSLEMFERDVQEVVDAYLAGTIRGQDLAQDARPWGNYGSDYAPMVELAKRRGLQVVAANAPRRYVSLAGRGGRAALAELPGRARAWLAPLPYAQPSDAYMRKVEESMAPLRQLEAWRRQQREQQDGQQAGERGAAQSKQPQPAKQQQQQPHQQQQQQAEPSAGSADACPAHAPSAATASSSERASAVGPASSSADVGGDDAAGTAAVAAAAVAAGGEGGGGACPYIGLSASSNFLDAQCLWDATMAHAIAGALAAPGPGGGAAPGPASAAQRAAGAGPAGSGGGGGNGDALVVHVCGKFHCEHGLGIPEHLRGYSPGARTLVVTFLPAATMRLGAGELAAEGVLPPEGCPGQHFVVLTDGDLPRSFDVQHPV